MKRFYKFLMPLVAIVALALPVSVTAQTTCQITIEGEDSFGDGWNGGGLTIMQGGTTVGTFTLSDDDYATQTFTVSSDDTVTFVWTSGTYDGEVSIVILDGAGQVAFSVEYPSAGVIFAMASPCPSCLAPAGLAATVDEATDDVEVTWTEGDGSSWQIVWGIGSFNPDTVTINTDNTTSGYYAFSGLDEGQYTVYVRTDCGDETSAWTSTTFCIGVLIMNMAATGTDTVYTCNGIIYDNGGPTGQYTANCQSTLVILPSDENSWLDITGSSYTEGTYDYLYIYEGIGTTGEVLYTDYGVSTTQTFGPFQASAVTVVFHSDGSVYYDGFQIDVSCVTAPDCDRPVSFVATSLTPDSAYFSWVDNNASGWIIEFGPTGFTTPDSVAEFTDTIGAIGNLTANTEYEFHLRALCDNGDTSLPRIITVRTPCEFVDSLPYSTSFEGIPTGSYDSFDFTDPCWTLLTDATSYPYVYVTSSSSYAHTGSNGVYWYRSSSTGSYGSYQCLVMPGVNVEDTPLSAMQLKFWARSTGASYYPVFRVGVLTNPNDINTFTEVATVNVGGNTDYSEFIVGFNDYTGDGRFVAIRADYDGSYWYATVDDFTLELAPNCPPVTEIHFNGASTSGAYLTWEYQQGLAGIPEQYEIEYADAADSTAEPVTMTTTEPYVFLSGLQPNTEYTFSVRVDCGDEDITDWVSTTFTTGGFGCLQVDTNTSFSDTIIDGTVTNTYIPSYSTYNYSLSQQIFTANEIGHGGTINKISFKPSAYTVPRNLEIYMGHVFDATATNYVYPSDLTLVYSGNAVSMTAGQWNELQFSTEFAYNGSDNLLILVRDMTGSWSSGNTWYGENGITGVSRYVYQDSGPYAIGSFQGGTGSTFRSSMVLGGSACAVQATCHAPVVGVTNIDSTSVAVGWAPGAEETEWNAYYREAGDTAWITAASGLTSTTYLFENLNPATNYEFSIATVCSEGEFSAVVTAITACAPMHLPITEDFENVSGIYERSCWVTGTTLLGTSNPYPQVVSLTGDPNKLCLLYNGAYLVFPQVAAPLNQLQIRFKLTQGGDNVHFLMGLLPSQDMPIDSIIVLDTLIRSNIDTSTATVNITYSFDAIPAEYNNYHIAFWDAFNDNYSFLDDIVLDYIPQCGSVSALSATATNNSATIAWDVNGENGTSYIVEYGPRGFTPGTGTQMNATASPVTINGLAHSTSYDAYVYTACSAQNDTSIASQVVMFTTECEAYTTLPYSTTFENILPPGSGTSVVMVPNCWGTETLTSGTAPRVYYTTTPAYAPSQSYCLYFYNPGVAALPQMAMPLDTLMISFHVYNPTPSSYGIIVGAVDSVTPGFAASFTPIDTIPFRGDVNEYDVVSYLTSYTGTANRIALMNYNVDPASSYATIYVDDLTVNFVPSCIAPQRVRVDAMTNVSADLSWIFSTAANYSIEYGPQGFTPGTGTTLTSNTNSVSLTGLTGNTYYDVRLVSLCSATEHSDTTVFTFRTLRAAPVTTLPYYCDFADSVEANSWEPVTGTSPNGWYVGSDTYYGNADSNSFYISDDDGATNNYNYSTATHIYAYRTFTLDAGSYNASFMWKANGESNYDYLRAYLVPANLELIAGIAPDGGTSSYSNATAAPMPGWIAIGSKLNQSSSWTNYSEELTITDPGNYNLVFYWGNDGSLGNQPPAAIDNIEFTRNVCPIYDIQLDTATGSTLTISWTGNSDSYEVEYGPTGFAHGTGISTTTTSTNITLNGLSSLTPYEIYVRGFCNVSDTSRWYRAVFATATCDDPDMITNWDSTLAAGTSTYSPLGTSFYNYGYVQIIIDSARMVEFGGDVTAFAFYSATAEKGDYYNHMDVYMSNVSESDLDGGFIRPDSNHAFVHVVEDGDFRYSEAGEHLVSFNAPFTWDGHSNVLIAIHRAHGTYSSGASFSAHTYSVAKTRYAYQDSGPYDINTISSSTGYTSNTVGDIKLIGCGAGCSMPVVSSVAVEAQSATVTAVGDGIAFELEYGTDVAELGNTMTSTTGVFNITGLQPETQYFYAVRQQCDSTTFSFWYTASFTTDELGCLPPTGLNVTGTGYNDVSLAWTVGNQETAWDVHVFSTTIDTIVTVTATTATVDGLGAGLAYSAAVRALCGAASDVPGPWSDTVQFTTDACQATAGVSVTAASTTATVIWNDMGSDSYTIYWGEQPFNLADALGQQTVNGTSYTITGLDQEEDYAVVVYNNCAAGLSVPSATVNFSTIAGGQDPTMYTITVTSNNNAWGTVTGGGTYAEGTTVTITATANEGYHFERWNDFDTNASRTITVTGDATYMANFAEDGTVLTYYTVTATSNNNAWGTVNGGGSYVEGTTVTLTATASNGYHFVQWVDSNQSVLSTANPYTFTATADVSVTAIFEADAQGIDDVAAGTMSLYPNPATTSVTLGLEGFEGVATVDVVDMNGRMIARYEVRDTKFEISVADMAPGAYFVRVTSGTQTAVRKLVVK